MIKKYGLIFIINMLVWSVNVHAKEESLSIWLSEDEAEMFRPAMENFQEMYPEVSLDIETYSIFDMKNASQQMKTQLMAGKGPDLLLFCSTGLDDVYKFLKAGVFAPLDEYMEMDKEWQAENYVSSVIDAGRIEGYQYVIPLTYRFMISMGSREALEQAEFDFSNAGNTLGFLSETAKLYQSDYRNKIMADGGLGSFPMFLSNQFLNYETGEIEIDEDVLKNACESYSVIYEDDFKGGFPENGYAGFGEMLANRDAYIYATNNMSGLLTAAHVLEASDTPVLIPLINMENETTADICRYAGIRANSENEQSAWNMLKLLLEEEIQMKIATTTAEIPVLKTIVGEVINDCMEEAYWDADAVVTAEDLEDSFVTDYYEYITNPGRGDFMNDFLLSDFYSYMEPFYKGEASFEECYEEFYMYAKIYLTE